MRSLPALQRALFPLLYLPSRLYAAVMRTRRLWYESGSFASYQPQRPTVSVGNIGWGGSGKTPLTEWLVRWAVHNNKRPVILTRGYKATPPELPFLVHEGSNAQEAGDEPLLLARSCPKADVIVDPVRSRGAQWAVDHLNPGMFFLDDGFQHLGIKRHLDLVLLRPSDLIQDWNRVIPAGPWREGEDALRAAEAFLIKCPPDEFAALETLITSSLRKFGKPVFNFSISPRGIKRLDRPQTARDFGGEPYLLVSGVGEPDQVTETATSLMDYPPVNHLRYDDHFRYTQDDWEFIEQEAQLKNAERVLCTSKDAVKLAALNTWNLWTIDTTLSFGGSFFIEQSFPEWWENTAVLL